MKKFFTILLILSNSAHAELRRPRMSENDLLSRVNKIEQNIVLLHKQMVGSYKGDSNKIETSSSNGYELEEKIQAYAEQIKSLRGEVEQVQFENNKLNDKLQKFIEDSEFRFKELEEIKITVPEVVDIKPLKTSSDNKNNSLQIKTNSLEIEKSKTSSDDQYKIAYETYQNGDKIKSIKLFEDFIDKYPDHQMTASAYYWQAEAAMEKKSYNEAALKYYKAYQKNPKGAKAADSLYKLSESLMIVKKNKEACLTINKLKKEFPKLNSNLKNKLDKNIGPFSLKCTV